MILSNQGNFSIFSLWKEDAPPPPTPSPAIFLSITRSRLTHSAFTILSLLTSRHSDVAILLALPFLFPSGLALFPDIFTFSSLYHFSLAFPFFFPCFSPVLFEAVPLLTIFFFFKMSHTQLRQREKVTWSSLSICISVRQGWAAQTFCRRFSKLPVDPIRSAQERLLWLCVLYGE